MTRHCVSAQSFPQRPAELSAAEFPSWAHVGDLAACLPLAAGLCLSHAYHINSLAACYSFPYSFFVFFAVLLSDPGHNKKAKNCWLVVRTAIEGLSVSQSATQSFSQLAGWPRPRPRPLPVLSKHTHTHTNKINARQKQQKSLCYSPYIWTLFE